MNGEPPDLVEEAVCRCRRRQPSQLLAQPAGEASNEAGQRPALWDCGARRRRRSKPEGEASWEGSERVGRHKRRDDGGDRGAAGSLYPGQAARGRVA
jgi:hypothetical protein